jgi:hypothetical protein
MCTVLLPTGVSPIAVNKCVTCQGRDLFYQGYADDCIVSFHGGWCIGLMMDRKVDPKLVTSEI